MNGKKFERDALLVFQVFLFFCVITGCKDDKTDSHDYDPSAPVEITDFTPKTGAARTRMFIYGKNFGSDVTQINVKIGGLPAKVIGSDGECLYCMVPPRAYDGTIQVTVGSEGVRDSVMATGKFDYQSQTIVSTLCGNLAESGEYKVIDGPFAECGFKEPIWMAMDPKNHKHIYLIESKASIRMLDLENEEVSTVQTIGQMNLAFPRTLAWSPGGDTMIVSNDQGNDNGISNSLLLRKDNFQNAQSITWSKSCNGSAMHPINGELYFSKYETGSIYRYDLNPEEKPVEMFRIWANSYEVNIQFHPSGNYAYLVIINQNTIMKSNYNWKEHKLEVPTVFCGHYGQAAYLDGVGGSARFKRPYQGVFVKNEDYVKQGKSDVYDFYICDSENDAIRKITPEGMVTTFAGRGSSGLDNSVTGYVDGDLRKEARFNRPFGIVYDEDSKTFYIADNVNHRIRFIAVENK